MADRRFVILRYVDKVPTMACCARCQYKFFTPKTYKAEGNAAEQYLREKFDLHKCREEEVTHHLRGPRP